MALSTEQRLKLLQAEHRQTVRDLVASLDLLEYYRDIAPSMTEEMVPPPNYWTRPFDGGCGWGVLKRGRILPKGKCEDELHAVKACWEHLRASEPRQHTQKPRPSTAHLDLGDVLDDDSAPTTAPTRRRRRVVT